MRLVIGSGTDVGLVRQGNEDAYIVQEPLFGVADGMGGHSAGDVASGTAVQTIQSGVERSFPHDTEALAVLVREANEAIWDRSSQDASLRGMGTTCTLVLIEDEEAHLAHVGDSRAYVWRDGELTQVTRDHTLVDRMVSEGRITVEEAARHPQRSIITRALGVDSSVEVDVQTIQLQEGDRLMICSDGLTSMINSAVISDVLASEPQPQRAVDALIELAKKAGGEDNITVVLIDVVPDDQGERVDTSESQPQSAPPHSRSAGAQAVERRPRRWLRPVSITLAIVVLLSVGGYMAARYALANSWFVGVTEEGKVAVFNGIPDEIVGMSLKEEEETSDLNLEELPEFKREDVEDGIRADSLDHASEILASLEELAADQDFQQEQKEQPAKDGKKP